MYKNDDAKSNNDSVNNALMMIILNNDYGTVKLQLK